VVDDGDPVDEVVGFVEVLGGEQDRGASGGEVAHEVPEVVAAGGVDADGGFGEEQHA
jgi:hypothetical protein